jgi:hypothetical protein
VHFRLWRRRTLQVLSALPLWLSAGAARGAVPVPRAVGYLPWWTASAWQTMPWQRLDRLVLFDAPIQRDGGVMDREWPKRAAGLVRDARIPLEVALTLENDADFNGLFADAAARSRLLANASRLLEQPYVAGLHLDVEGFNAAPGAAISGFRDWLVRLDRARAGKILSAFFPASDRFTPYDAEAARHIDYWVAQVYDAHWRESRTTGPLVTRAGDNPVAVPRALARLAALGVARQKVLLSVPLYGWQWTSETEHPGAATRGGAKLLTFAQTPQALMPENRLAAIELARHHGLRRDGEDTPYYVHREGSHWVQGWYEDVHSLTRKLAPERAQAYAGLAFFPLGYDGGAVVEGLLRWWRSGER